MLVLEKGDQCLAVVGVLQARERHLGAGDEFPGIGDVGVERRLVPGDAGILVGAGVAEPGNSSSLPSHDPIEARADLVLARFDRVADDAVFLNTASPASSARATGAPEIKPKAASETAAMMSRLIGNSLFVRPDGRTDRVIR